MYPRIIEVEDKKLKELLAKKTDLVLEGREVSIDIEEIEKGNEIVDKQIQELEAKVDLKEFKDLAEESTKKMQTLLDEANKIQSDIYAKLKAEVPPELGIKYSKNKELISELEKKRNKIGLKIQKTKDLIIPITQKLAKPLLEDEFEDLGDVRLENGKVIIEIISHLEAWKQARAKKLNEKYLS